MPIAEGCSRPCLQVTFKCHCSTCVFVGAEPLNTPWPIVLRRGDRPLVVLFQTHVEVIGMSDVLPALLVSEDVHVMPHLTSVARVSLRSAEAELRPTAFALVIGGLPAVAPQERSEGMDGLPAVAPRIEERRLERVRGVEPLSPGWKPEVMPLYDTRGSDLGFHR